MNRQRILDDFSRFISIPSVSADPMRKKDMAEIIIFLKQKLESLGFEVELLQNRGDPATIYARRHGQVGAKTIGIYGHYDVQPEDPVMEWKTSPFVLTQKNGKFYGRGTADNKGHIIQNIATIEQLILSKSLKHNIIFLIEGEEETGSENFETHIVEKYKELSEVDVFFITDVEMYKKNVPMIIYALRGLVYFEVIVTIGECDLHSGVYGNAVYNPAHILADLMTKMKDFQTGEVRIPGFYDAVREIDQKEMKLLESADVSDDEFRRDAGTMSVISMRHLSSFLSPKLLPSLDIHGINSGFVGEGPKTIIPRQGLLKFSCRLIEHQDVKSIGLMINKFIVDHMPAGVKYKMKSYSYDNPFYCSLDDPYIQKTAKILSDHFRNKTIFMREGGTIPAAEIIQRVLNKPIVLTGFVLSDSNLHAPNENFDEDMFWEGIEALKKVYSNI